MRIRSQVLAVISALFLFACGGTKEEAKAPESDVWEGYKGTYATQGSGSHAAAASKPDDAEPQAKSKAAAPEKATDGDSAAVVPTPTAVTSAKKASHGTIQGESVSSISPDSLADATKTAFKSKVISSKVVVGAQYEQVSVLTKTGTSIQIIRPASSPAADGPNVSAPKAKNGSLAKTESGWYDEDADVLVIVSSTKKGGSAKVLGMLVKK